MKCECCDKDENGNWVKDPCCNNGECTSDGNIGMCIHCGAEMFEEKGSWFHRLQSNHVEVLLKVLISSCNSTIQIYLFFLINNFLINIFTYICV